MLLVHAYPCLPVVIHTVPMARDILSVVPRTKRKHRVLSTRELNRALLGRQLLLERSTLPIPGALERLGGLQTQYAPSAYVAL